MRRLIALPASLFAVAPALAHELPGAHAHPHGDWSASLALLLAGGVIFALFALRHRAARRSRGRKHDPR